MPLALSFFKKEKEVVGKVQRTATKMINEYQKMSNEERLHNFKLLTLMYRRKRGCMINGHKFVFKKKSWYRHRSREKRTA